MNTQDDLLTERIRVIRDAIADCTPGRAWFVDKHGHERLRFGSIDVYVDGLVQHIVERLDEEGWFA
jgi:hypothetical protein